MKIRYPKLIAALALLLAASAVTATAQWYNYTDGSIARVLLNDGNVFWVGLNGGGLVKVDKGTGTRTYYSRANSGLRDMHVNTLLKDGDGALWIGTANGGLMKFDGNSTWVSYKTNNSWLPSNSIEDLAIDGSGNLWIATDEGLVRFNRSNDWKVFNRDDWGVEDSRLLSVAVDANNNVWVGHLYRGLWKYSGGTWKNFKPSSFVGGKDDTVSAIATNVNGKMWIGNHSGLVMQVDEAASSWTSIDFSLPQQDGFKTPDEAIYDISQGPDGKMLVSTYTNLAIWDPASQVAVRYPTTPTSNAQLAVFSAFADADGSVWCAKMDGIASNKTGTFVKASLSETGLVGNNISGILVTKDNTKWFCSHTLTRFDSQWKTWQAGQFEYRNINTMAIDSTGNAWLATDNGVDMGNPSTGSFARQSLTGAGRKFKSIVVDKNNNVWAGGEEGLAKYNGTSWTVYTTSNSGIPFGSISSLALDRDGTTLWLGMDFSGIAKFDGSNWTKYSVNDHAEMGSDIVHSIAVDPTSGDVWLATADAGCAKLSGTTFTQYATFNAPMPTDNMSAIAVDRNGVVWMGTGSQGLIRKKGNTWNVFSSENSGLSDDRINCLYISQDLQIWIGTVEGGVVRYDELAVSGVERSPIGTSAGMLLANSPNPFSGNTNIHVRLDAPTQVRLSVVDATGSEVAVVHNGTLEAGETVVPFNGTALASGMYFVRIAANGHVETRPVVIAR